MARHGRRQKKILSSCAAKKQIACRELNNKSYGPIAFAEGRLPFAFRPLNGKQKGINSLRALRLCGESFIFLAEALPAACETPS